jgi:hypothetical protein
VNRAGIGTGALAGSSGFGSFSGRRVARVIANGVISSLLTPRGLPVLVLLGVRTAEPGRDEKEGPDRHDGEVEERAAHRHPPGMLGGRGGWRGTVQPDAVARQAHLVTSRTVNARTGLDEDAVRCVAD